MSFTNFFQVTFRQIIKVYQMYKIMFNLDNPKKIEAERNFIYFSLIQKKGLLMF